MSIHHKEVFLDSAKVIDFHYGKDLFEKNPEVYASLLRTLVLSEQIGNLTNVLGEISDNTEEGLFMWDQIHSANLFQKNAMRDMLESSINDLAVAIAK